MLISSGEAQSLFCSHSKSTFISTKLHDPQTLMAYRCKGSTGVLWLCIRLFTHQIVITHKLSKHLPKDYANAKRWRGSLGVAMTSSEFAIVIFRPDFSDMSTSLLESGSDQWKLCTRLDNMTWALNRPTENPGHPLLPAPNGR